jgi:hypothetical protein
MFGFSEYGVAVKGPRGGMHSYRSIAALEKAIKAKKDKIAKLQAARKKAGFFSAQRRAISAAIAAERRFLVALERALAATKKHRRVIRPRDVANGALTAAQVAAIQAMIQRMIAAGADADQAEEAAKARVLPPHLLRAVPRGFFRGVRRAGPRPAGLPTFVEPSYSPMPGELPGPTRDLDPIIRTRDIDPIVRARSIDPDPRVRSLDPVGNNVPLLPGLGPQAGSFTFPPGNITDEDPDTMDDGLDGIVDTVKEYASKPWVMGLAAIGAVLYGPKLLRSLKGGTKKNPRRRRHKHNRRHRRSHR